MTDVVNKLWDFCNYLRHDGITYGDYIEQLTYLLFLKMVQEKDIMMPEGCSWDDLIQYSGSELLEGYSKMLLTLAKEKGMLGDIFAQSLSRFNNPINLKKLLNLINEIEWTSLDVDIKAAAYEGLLEKYAAEEKGAGQYFTPRVVIRSIVKCIRPDFRRSPDYTIHDPACGTGGFLIGAFEWIMKETDNGSKLTIKDRERLVKNTFSGMDNVQNTRRLALMNCYLHELEATIYYGDSLGEGQHVGKRYNVVLTNPPFGTRGAGGAPSRDDFLVTTSNKQLNFVQHAMTLLKIGGQAAIVVPDNVLFENSGREVRENLMKSCNLHTILRLPEGTFSPYSPGVKANVIFFSKGLATQEIWIYDLRTNVKNINKGNPLDKTLFEDFELNYDRNPKEETERFKKFTKQDIEERNYNLDIFWLKDRSSIDSSNLPDPMELAGEAITHVQTALDSLEGLIIKLTNEDSGT
jgi:type I restriction enzyme M protein